MSQVQLCFVRASDVLFTHPHLSSRATNSSALFHLCFRNDPLYGYLLGGAHPTCDDHCEPILHFWALRVFPLHVTSPHVTFPHAFTLYARFRYAPTTGARAFVLYGVHRDGPSRGVLVPTAIHCGATCVTPSF